MKSRSAALVLATGLVMLAGAAPAAQETAETKDSVEAVARKVFEQNRDAIVGVRMVCNVRLNGPGTHLILSAGLMITSAIDRSAQFTSSGVIVNDSGMVVCPLAAIDRFGYRTQYTREVVDVKVMLGDGTEIPADVVMGDADLGIEFIRIRKDAPEAKGKEFKAIDLRNIGDAGVFDKVIGLDRMSGALSYQPSVRIGSIIGLTTKPKKLLLCKVTHPLGAMPFGAAFCADGKLLGFVVLKQEEYSPKTPIGPRGLPKMVIQPAADVLKALDQAMEVKVEPEKEEPVKKE